MKLNVKLDTNYRVADIERDDTKPDWMGDYQLKNSQVLPLLPGYLAPLVNGYKKGEPIGQSIEVIPIGGQQWQEMSSQQRNELLELVEFTGQDVGDYIKTFQCQYPKDPDFRKRLGRG